MLKKVAQFFVAPAIIVAFVALLNVFGTKDVAAGDTAVAQPVAVKPEPAVQLDPKGVNPLPVSVARNRVTAKHLAIVCPGIFDLERGLNLHNAKRVDQALSLGCRYVRPGEQGVRLQHVSNMQEILFDTADGSRAYWGYVSHFVWEP